MSASGNLGDTAGRTPRALAIVDGNFRNPRHNGSTAGAESENRKVPKREEGENQRPLDPNQLGLPACRIPQETGIPGDAARVPEITRSRFAVRGVLYVMARATTPPTWRGHNQKASSLKWRLPFSAFAYSSLLRIFSSSCMSVRRKFRNHVSIRCRSCSTSSVI